MDMGKDEFHSYTQEGFFTIRCSDRFWVVSGLTWPHNRYWHAQRWFLMGSHEGAQLQRTLWLSGCGPVCISPFAPVEERNGHQAESSEQYCEACHHKGFRPAQQADLATVKCYGCRWAGPPSESLALTQVGIQSTRVMMIINSVCKTSPQQKI